MIPLPAFPRTLAAVKKGEKSLWDIGDALLDECGPPSDHGGDHKENKLEAARLYLLAKGYDYSRPGLSNLRRIAYRFPSSTRNSEIAWSAHAAAGTPERLQAIIACTENIAEITARYVEKMIDAWHQRNLAQQQAAEKKAIEAREQAEEEYREAIENHASAEATEALAVKVEQAKNVETAASAPPKRRAGPPPDPEESPQMIAELKCSVEVSKAIQSAEKAREKIEPLIFDLDPDVRIALVTEARQAMNAWQEFAEYVERRGAQRPLLTVVGSEESNPR